MLGPTQLAVHKSQLEQMIVFFDKPRAVWDTEELSTLAPITRWHVGGLCWFASSWLDQAFWKKWIASNSHNSVPCWKHSKGQLPMTWQQRNLLRDFPPYLSVGLMDVMVFRAKELCLQKHTANGKVEACTVVWRFWGQSWLKLHLLNVFLYTQWLLIHDFSLPINEIQTLSKTEILMKESAAGSLSTLCAARGIAYGTVLVLKRGWLHSPFHNVFSHTTLSLHGLCSSFFFVYAIGNGANGWQVLPITSKLAWNGIV